MIRESDVAALRSWMLKIRGTLPTLQATRARPQSITRRIAPQRMIKGVIAIGARCIHFRSGKAPTARGRTGASLLGLAGRGCCGAACPSVARFDGNEKPPGLVVDRTNATLDMEDIGGEWGNCRPGLTLFALRRCIHCSAPKSPTAIAAKGERRAHLLRRATWLFPQLYEMPNRAKGSQEATATAIIAVSGLVWVALP